MTNVDELTLEEQKVLLAKLLEENAALKAKATEKLGFKVTDGGQDGKGSKGLISVYGLQRFPVTLSIKGWVSLDKLMVDLFRFAEAHWDELSFGKEGTSAEKLAETEAEALEYVTETIKG